MTNNTIPNVQRELLANLLGNDHDKRIMAERHLLAMLANAPSPAGVDGLDVVSNWVLFDAEADKPYIKKMLPEGFLAFFDCEEDARRAKANNPGTDYKRIDRVKAEDAQAIIDGLRGDAATLKEQSETRLAAYVRESNIRREIEQQRDQLACLLREARQHHGVMLLSDPPQDAWKFYGMEGRIDAALSGIKEPQ